MTDKSMPSAPPILDTEISATVVVCGEGRERHSLVARVVWVNSPRVTDHSIVGQRIEFVVAREWVHALKTRANPTPGLLYRVYFPTQVVDDLIQHVAEKADDADTVVGVRLLWLKQMNEPCVRVPLSLLKELRGMVSYYENSRQALLTTWIRDRRTGYPHGSENMKVAPSSEEGDKTEE